MAEYDVMGGASFGTSLDGFDMLPSTGEIVDTATFNGVLISTTGSIVTGTTVPSGSGANLVLQHSDSLVSGTFTDVSSDQINGSLPSDLLAIGATTRSLSGYLGKLRYLRVEFRDSSAGDMNWAGGVNIILLKGGNVPY